jgi:flagellar basal-body rod modification protein FlgD
MDLSPAFNPEQMLGLQRNVDAFNKLLNGERQVKQFLDKDDFMKILITQLTHQDPTEPLKDQEFIAQMAQFSSLEQMMNMGNEIAKVSVLLNRSQAFTLHFQYKHHGIQEGKGYVPGSPLPDHVRRRKADRRGGRSESQAGGSGYAHRRY